MVYGLLFYVTLIALIALIALIFCSRGLQGFCPAERAETTEILLVSLALQYYYINYRLIYHVISR